MAQLRLIGEPGEVDAILRALEGRVRVADVSRRGSRYNAGDVRVYAHAEPIGSGGLDDVLDAEVVEDPALPSGRRALPLR